MKCFNCNATCTQEAKFCLNCGSDLGRPSAPQIKQSSQFARRPTNSYPHPGSLAKWREMKARKLKTSFLFVGIALLATFAAVPMSSIDPGGLLLAFFVCMSIIWIAHRVSQKNYYALPHARDEDGEHRCIFCGGRGIYRKGVYKSSTVHSNCSKCQKRLFTDLM